MKNIIKFSIICILFAFYLQTANWFSAISDQSILAFCARIGFGIFSLLAILQVIEKFLPDKYLDRK